MKRKLISQMLHEWRSNIWMAIELMIVGGVVCWLFYSLFTSVRGLYQPLGFDAEDVYNLDVKIVDKESPYYIDGGEKDADILYHDVKTVIANLRNHPAVEAVAVHWGAAPYSMNYQGNTLSFRGMPDTVRYYGNTRWATPDIVRVLRLQSDDGLTSEEIEKRMRNREYFISDGAQWIYNGLGKIRDLVGREAAFGGDTSNYNKIGGLVYEIRRNAYELRNGGMLLCPIIEDEMPLSSQGGYTLLVRLKQGMGTQFLEDFKTNRTLRKLRNVELTNLQSLQTARFLTERNFDINVRLYIAMVIFFLVMAFLGLLGTFWYRVQQRTGEIALRKVAGARNRNIFSRLCTEGTLLMTAGFIPGAVIFAIVLRKIIEAPLEGDTLVFVWIAIAAAYLIMEIIILLGIFFPAYRAIRIEPAIALKEE